MFSRSAPLQYRLLLITDAGVRGLTMQHWNARVPAYPFFSYWVGEVAKYK